MISESLLVGLQERQLEQQSITNGIKETMSSDKKTQWIYAGVSACFLLSGFAALLYQTAWMRQFSTVFGTSELAVATVLSAYMGGLALGAGFAGKYIGKVRRPVYLYGVLEAAIAISALLVPLLLSGASLAYAAILGGQPQPPDASGLGQSIFYFVVAFAVLASPTACMGATLPLLTRYAVNSDKHIGSRVGVLYAINTAGAVAGTLVAAFILLPALGLIGTVCFGVVVNLLVFVLAVFISKNASEFSEQPIDKELDENSAVLPEVHVFEDHGSIARPGHWTRMHFILPIMLLSGTTSFVYEVLWTRLLSHILGGSVAAFATMLASFLSGIAIGSAIASRFAVTAERSLRAFVIVQLAIAFTSMAIYRWLYLVIPAEEGLSGNVGIAIAILLPATLFIGATFPLAVRIYATGAAGAASSSAKVYSWNTIGAIFGAAFAGFFLIPALKYEGAIKVVVITNILLALGAAALITSYRNVAIANISVVLIALILVYQPQAPEQILRTSPIDDPATGDILYYEVGRSSTVFMFRSDGVIGLRNNGLPEAGSALLGSPPQRNTQHGLATLPSLIRPDAESMLIVGLGGGNAVTGVSPSVKEIDVIELEPKVVEANRLAGSLRDQDPLLDPRLSIYINDARSALSLTTKTYDAIISQPSHPWTAGASHLYTQEYMQLAADHMTEDGVFLQWMASQFISEDLLRSLCATMLEVFDYVKVYHLFPEVLFFVGSQQPMNTERVLANTGRPVIDHPAFYYQRGLVSAEDLLAGLLLDTEGAKAFSEGADLLTDNFNRMATDSAAALESGSRLSLVDLVDLLQPYVPVLDAQSWVHRELNFVDFAYVSKRFEDNNMRPFSMQLAATLEETRNWQSLLLTGLGLRRQGDTEEAQRVLQAAVASAPEGEGSNQAIYALVEPWLVPLSFGEAPEQIADQSSRLTGSAAAVVLGRKAFAERDWLRLAELDPYFIESKSTDLWFVESTKLMVEWRNYLSRVEGRSELAAQARQIIDLAIATHPVPDLYSARIASAYFADLPHEVLETARRLTHILESELDSLAEDVADQELANLRIGFREEQLNLIDEAVKEMAVRHDLSETSVAEVLEQIDRVKNRSGQN